MNDIDRIAVLIPSYRGHIHMIHRVALDGDRPVSFYRFSRGKFFFFTSSKFEVIGEGFEQIRGKLGDSSKVYLVRCPKKRRKYQWNWYLVTERG